MPILTFNNASDAAVADDLRINSSAVRYIEASRPGQKGQTMIYLLGQGAVGIPVVESVDAVVAAVGGTAAAKRHYRAGAPGGSASTVHVCIATVGFLRSSKQGTPPFWNVYFTDGSELRVMDPLPPAL